MKPSAGARQRDGATAPPSKPRKQAAEPDWPKTVRILLEHGASTDEVTLAPDDPKPPSADVAVLLRTHIEGRQR